MTDVLSLIIPCYNERATLRHMVERVLAAPPADLRKELVIVDDCSTDGSREMLRTLAAEHPEIKALYHEKNRGKGAAVRTGQQACTGTFVIIQDADLEYSPDDYPALLAPIRSGSADVVYGSRFAGGRPHRSMFFWHMVGNRLLSLLSNMTTNLNISDMETCYKAFRGEYFRQIPIQSNRFGFEPEITAKVARLGLRVYEVPIEYHGRTYMAGKKIGWKDGLAAIFTILRYWLTDGLAAGNAGLDALQAMRYARRFNAWTFRQIAPHIGERVMEAGAGLGNITLHLLNRELILALDQNAMYIDRVRHTFADNPNVRAEVFDLADTAAFARFQPDRLDTVLCINVLEHIERDDGVLKAFHDTLAPGGRVIILVPQGRWLFGSTDRAVGHFRRYTRKELAEKMTAAGFTVERMVAFNRVGTLGWFVNGRILRRKTLSSAQLRLFDSCLTFVRIAEYVLPLPGLSLIAIGKKREPVG
jgi:glycosyltransferase involved in cell wall biosynthesis